MLGGTPEDWIEFGRHGPEDLEALRVAAVMQTLEYCKTTLSTIKTMRRVLAGLAMLFASAWTSGAIVVVLVVRPQEVVTNLAAFGSVISAGAAALGALALFLRRMERDVSTMLRAAARTG